MKLSHKELESILLENRTKSTDACIHVDFNVHSFGSKIHAWFIKLGKPKLQQMFIIRLEPLLGSLRALILISEAALNRYIQVDYCFLMLSLC